MCSSGYIGPDCSDCDPILFSVTAPEWGSGASKCSITDSTTSFVGVDPTPTRAPAGGGGESSNVTSFKKLLTPLYLGAVGGGFLILLLVMVAVIYRIRRGRGGPRSQHGSRGNILRIAVTSPRADSAFGSESMMSMGTPPADSDGLHDNYSLAQSNRGYNLTAGGAVKPKRSDDRVLITGPRSDVGTSDVRIPRGFDRPSRGSSKPPGRERSFMFAELSGSVNKKYTGGYELQTCAFD